MVGVARLGARSSRCSAAGSRSSPGSAAGSRSNSGRPGRTASARRTGAGRRPARRTGCRRSGPCRTGRGRGPACHTPACRTPAVVGLLSWVGMYDGALRSCGDGTNEEAEDVGYGATEYGIAEYGIAECGTAEYGSAECWAMSAGRGRGPGRRTGPTTGTVAGHGPPWLVRPPWLVMGPPWLVIGPPIATGRRPGGTAGRPAAAAGRIGWPGAGCIGGRARRASTRAAHGPDLLAGPRLVLLVLPGRLAEAELVGRAEAAATAGLPRPVERLPGAAAADEQVARERVVAAGEEDALDAAADLLHAGAGLRTGDDDDVAGGHADDELTGNRALEPGPEIAGEHEARFETLERQHQRRRLSVELGPRREHLEVLERGPAQDAVGKLHLVQVGMGDDTPPELRSERIDDAKVRAELIHHRIRIETVGVPGGQEGNKRGARHLHARQPSGCGPERKAPGVLCAICPRNLFRRRNVRAPPGGILTLPRRPAPVAQWIEQLPSKQLVAGSNPAGRTPPLHPPPRFAQVCAHRGEARPDPGQNSADLAETGDRPAIMPIGECR